MKNEWRDNVWLIIELMVVCLAIWTIITLLYIRTSGLFLPRGFEPEDVYTLEVGNLGTKNPNYQSLGDSVSKETAIQGYYEDYAALLRRIRENPNVVSVAPQSSAVPYNYNYNGCPLFLFDVLDSVSYYGNMRKGSPDLVDALGLTSATGKSRAQLKEIMAQGQLLISANGDYESYDRDPASLIGKRVILGTDSTTVYTVGDLIQKVRRNDYEDSWGGTIVVPWTDESKYWGDLIIRVKPGRGDAFREDLKNNPDLRRQRNVYFSNLKSLMDIREGNQRSADVQVRMFVVLMCFLLITVFLGLLGTFWFRMQQRVSEIAIRKVCGATRGEIFRRILGEGMILLCIATVLASACVWPFFNKIYDIIYQKWYVVLIAEGATVVFIAIGIVLSVWYPARKAMSIEPAIAIKAE